MGDGLAVSVVIPTHNRRASLLRTLDALAAQTLAPDRFEVIVALDAVTDGSAAAIASRSWPFPLRTTVPAGRGAAATRNAGAALARAPRIVFLDDDIRTLPRFLEAHLAAASGSSERVVVGRSTPDVAGRGWFYEGLRGWWTGRFAELANPGHRFGYTDVMSGNLSLSRDLFARLGGFDERLACREDYELGYRAMRAGAQIVYAASAEGLHRDESSPTRSVQRARAEGVGDVAIARKHPELFATMHAAELLAATPASWLLRLVTFRAPAIVARGLAAMGAPLRMLEALGLRDHWTQLGRWRWALAYNSGVAAAAGSPAGLRALRCLRTGAEPRGLDLDLCDGIEAARLAVDRVRPEGCTIRIGAQKIGALQAGAGLELPERRHLDGWLRDNAWRWSVHVAAAEILPVPADGVPLPLALDGAWCAGAIDVGTWTTQTSRSRATLPLAALVRRGESNLDWIWVEASAARNGALPTIRSILLSDRKFCEAVLRETIAPRPALLDADRPDISVVVCTRNRTDSLAECLEALRALDYPRYEIIVVDNAPTTNATARLVAALPRVVYVREDRPGLDWARNRGVVEARSGIIAFTDDDTRADPRWLAGIARAFADPGISAVTGLVAPMELATKPEQYFELVYGGMGKGLRPRRWSLEADGPRGILWASGCGVGANMAFRRDALVAVGPFDTALDVGTPTRGGGDVEMFHRLLARGHELQYTPDAMVWHRHRTDWAGLGRQMADNGSGFAAFLLSAWRGRSVPRRVILRFAVQDWLWNWQVRRLIRRGRHSRILVLREIGGLLCGPLRARRARRQAAKMLHTWPAACEAARVVAPC